MQKVFGRLPARGSTGGATGYTLVELLIVMAVLGILAGLALPLVEIQVQRDKERELKRALWEIRDAIDDYRRAQERSAGTGQTAALYPPSLQALVATPDAAATSGRPRFLRRVPRDPFADPTLPADRTWGLRSYLSEASSPKEGTDVYDVYSKSERQGLNGVPLKEW